MIIVFSPSPQKNIAYFCLLQPFPYPQDKMATLPPFLYSHDGAVPDSRRPRPPHGEESRRHAMPRTTRYRPYADSSGPRTDSPSNPVHHYHAVPLHTLLHFRFAPDGHQTSFQDALLSGLVRPYLPEQVVSIRMNYL